jgi:predicted secreted protein
LEVRKISLRKGETHQIRLGGLGSAGYAWDFIIEGSSNIVEVSTEQVDTSSLPPPGGYPPGSSNTDTLFTIKALKIGKTQIKLILRRSWEKNKPPLRGIFLEVNVSE